MKRFMSLFTLVLAMSGCIPATSIASHGCQKMTIVTTSPIRRVHFKRPKAVKKTVIIGTYVEKLPAKGVTIYHNHLPFVYINGVYYKKLNSSKYEIIKPEIGMIVPQLPDYNVEELYIKGETLFLFDNTLYKQIPTTEGLKYKVTGFIN